MVYHILRFQPLSRAFSTQTINTMETKIMDYYKDDFRDLETMKKTCIEMLLAENITLQSNEQLRLQKINDAESIGNFYREISKNYKAWVGMVQYPIKKP